MRGGRRPRRQSTARDIRMAAASCLFDHRDGAAQRGLAALEPPRKASEKDLLVDRLVGPDAPDDRVHRMVGAARVDREPAHAAVEHPLRELARRAGVADEVARLVELRTVAPVLRVVAVVAGVDHEDVAALYPVACGLLPPLEVLWTVNVEVADTHALEVDHARGADQEVEGQVADELAAGHEVRRRVEVRADVQRHRDLLAAGAIEGQVLDPPDLRTRVAGEGRRVQGKVLREVEELHWGELSFLRSTLPMALRGNFSITTTRRGHL